MIDFPRTSKILFSLYLTNEYTYKKSLTIGFVYVMSIISHYKNAKLYNKYMYYFSYKLKKILRILVKLYIKKITIISS